MDALLSSLQKHHVVEHVESRHVEHTGYACHHCSYHTKSRNALRNHKYRHHRGEQQSVVLDKQ